MKGTSQGEQRSFGCGARGFRKIISGHPSDTSIILSVSFAQAARWEGRKERWFFRCSTSHKKDTVERGSQDDQSNGQCDMTACCLASHPPHDYRPVNLVSHARKGEARLKPSHRYNLKESSQQTRRATGLRGGRLKRPSLQISTGCTSSSLTKILWVMAPSTTAASVMSLERSDSLNVIGPAVNRSSYLFMGCKEPDLVIGPTLAEAQNAVGWCSLGCELKPSSSTFSRLHIQSSTFLVTDSIPTLIYIPLATMPDSIDLTLFPASCCNPFQKPLT